MLQVETIHKNTLRGSFTKDIMTIRELGKLNEQSFQL